MTIGQKLPDDAAVGEGRAPVLRSLENGLDLLSLFVSLDRRTIEVRHIVEVLGLPRSTAYRLVRTLERRQFLSRGARRGTYEVGALIGLLALHIDRIGDLARAIRPFLVRIVRETGETAFLTVRDGAMAQCIDFVESPAEVRLSVQRGSRFALHAGASGQIFLAWMTRRELDAYLARPLAAYTDFTITDPAVLRQVLLKVRAQGYALSENQTGPGTLGLCVPVWAGGGRLVAGITLSAPAFRSSREALLARLDLLQMCAAEVTEVLEL